MAQVPNYGGHQIMPTIMGYKPVSDNIPNLPRPDVEGAMGRIGDKLDKFYTKFLEEQDEARVTSALTDLRRKAIDMESGEGGWASQLGENALTPDEDGVGLVDRSDRGLQEYGASLTEKFTPRQQELFNRQAQTIYQAAYAGVSQHVYQQAVSQKKAAQEGAIAQAVESGASYVNKPDMLRQSEKLIRDSAQNLSGFMGWTKENTDLYIRKNVSAMYMNGVVSLLAGADNNPALAYQAQGVLQAHSKDMLASDVAKARQQIQPILQAHEDRVKAEGFVAQQGNNGEALLSATGNALKAGVLQQDSVDTARGYEAIVATTSHFAQTKTTGEKGSSPASWKHGAAQLTVEDAMDAAKAAGIPWDVHAFKTDKGYNEAIGVARYCQVLKACAGDEDKAMAAYLTSVETVSDAEKQAREKGGIWTDYLPKNAQATLSQASANMRKMKTVVDEATGKTVTGFDPAYAKSAKKWSTAEDARAYFKQTDARAAVDPVYCDSLVTKSMALLDEKKRTYVQEQNNIKAEISDILFKSHGDMSQIPSNLLQRLDVNELAAVQKVAKHYQSDTFASDPLILGRLSDDNLLGSLQESELKLYLNALNGADRQRILAKWASLKQKNAGATDTRFNEVRDANLGIVNDKYVVSSDKVMHVLKQNETFAKMFKDHPDTAYIILGEVSRELSLSGQFSGKKLNDVEVNKEIWRATREVANVSGFFTDTEKPAIFLTVKDLPSSTNTDAMQILKATAKAQLAGMGQDREPTDEELQYCLTKIMLGGDKLNVVVPEGVGFDNPLMDEIKTEWAKKHGSAEMPKAQQLRYYFIARAGRRYAKPYYPAPSVIENKYMEIEGE